MHPDGPRFWATFWVPRTLELPAPAALSHFQSLLGRLPRTALLRAGRLPVCAPLNLSGAQGQAFVEFRTKLGGSGLQVCPVPSRQSGACGQSRRCSVELQGLWESSEFSPGFQVGLKVGGQNVFYLHGF